jgi:hypothetical protein
LSDIASTACCIQSGIVRPTGFAQSELELVRCIGLVKDIDLVRDGLVRNVPGRTIVDDLKGHVNGHLAGAKDLVLRVTIGINPGSDLGLFFGRQRQLGRPTALQGIIFGLNGTAMMVVVMMLLFFLCFETSLD